jgi:hypothetical protein
MPVSLAIPSFSVVLGGFDITSRLTRLELARPFPNKDEPQYQRGSFALSAWGLADFTQYDEVTYPTRWLRCQQSLVITIKGILYFTGFIDNYRFNRQDKVGTGDIIDQIVALDFERSPAVQIPINVQITPPKPITYEQIRQNSFAIYYAVKANALTISNTIGIPIQASQLLPYPVLKQDPAIIKGVDMGLVCQNLVKEAGKINGTTVFSNVSAPTLTGDRTTQVVSGNPIRLAQQYAGADSVWMFSNPDGSISWKAYPANLSVAPIVQLAESQTASFKPDLTVKRASYSDYVIEGTSEFLASNPDYIPATTTQQIIQVQPANTNKTAQSRLPAPVSSVQTTTTSAIGNPYAPKQIALSGKASFSDQGITPYSPQTEKQNVGYLYNQAQADKLCLFLGTLEIQKSNSYLVQVPILDEFLNNPSPFQIIHIADRAMVICAPQLIIDGSTKQAYLNFTGYVFGKIPAITNPAAPAAIPAPIYTVDSIFESVEIELSEFGSVDTSVSDLVPAEIEGGSVGLLVAGFSQWHRSEESITDAAISPKIKTWGDLSGNGLNFTGKLGSEPQKETLSRLNGKQVITFINTSDAFFVTDIAISNPLTVYLVIRTQTWTGDRRIFGAGNLNLIINGTTVTLSVGNTSLTRTLALDTWALVTVVVDGANSRLKVGASEITGTLEDFSSDYLAIGAAAAFRIAEFIRYPFNVNSDDDALISAYFEDRYNLVDRSADTDDPASVDPVVPGTPSAFVPDSRTLTINGVTYDLTANRSWTVSGGGGSVTWTTITSNTAATSGNGYIYNNAGNTATLTLPSSPSSGNQVGACLQAGTELKIALNGEKFNGYANDRTIKDGNGNFIPIVFNYVNSAVGWTILDNNIQGIVRAQFWDKVLWHFPFDEPTQGERTVTRVDSLLGLLATEPSTTVARVLNKINGKSQYGVNLSTASRYLAVPDSVNTKLGRGSYPTFGIMIGLLSGATQGSGVFPSLFTKVGGSTLRSYDLYYNGTSGQFTFFVSSDGTTGANSANAVVTNTCVSGTPYLLYAYRDSTNNLIGLSVNGGTAGTTAWSNTLFDTSATLKFGQWDGASSFTTQGSFYLATAFSSLLTTTELSEIYNNGAWNRYPIFN